jgi:hypothetical protein
MVEEERTSRCAPVCSAEWAGVRGGKSVSVVLSLPDSPTKTPILAPTYAVVLFSVICCELIGCHRGANSGRNDDCRGIKQMEIRYKCVPTGRSFCIRACFVYVGTN